MQTHHANNFREFSTAYRSADLQPIPVEILENLLTIQFTTLETSAELMFESFYPIQISSCTWAFTIWVYLLHLKGAELMF